jgi:hypothetical protein
MYGLFADWVQEVSLAADERAAKTGGGKQIVADMLNGAETYLQLWERAVYGVNSCVSDQSSLDVSDLNALLGGNLEGFLDAAGQPVDRTDDAYVYCAEQDGEAVVVDVVLDGSGRPVEVRPSTSGVVPAPAEAADPAPVHDHGHAGHPHAPAGVPADGGLALGALLVVGMTGLGAGTLTGRYRLG